MLAAQGTTTPKVHQFRRARGGSNKELGVLMLLLAAESMSSDCSIASSKKDALSTELFAASHLSDMAALSSASATRMFNNKILSASATPFDSNSSAGDSDTAGTPVPESMTADDAVDEDATSDRYTTVGGEDGLISLTLFPSCTTQPMMASVTRPSLGTESTVVAAVMSYLDWRENLNLRRVNRTWFEGSLSQAVLCRMPATGCTAVFLPCRRDLDASEAADESRLSTCAELEHNASSWLCELCGWFNDNRVLCGNRSCHAMAPSAQAASGGSSRIFLGQLRREGTVPLIRWLFEHVLLEPKALMMVENHRHKITGRGKGCAWVYVQHSHDGAACAKLLSYHRRLFVDVVNGVEGVWIVHPSNLEALSKEVGVRGYAQDRARFLPRNALVTELPLAQAIQLNATTGTATTATVSSDAPTTNRPERAVERTAVGQQPTVSATARRSVGLSPFAVPFHVRPTVDDAAAVAPVLARRRCSNNDAEMAIAPPPYAEAVSALHVLSSPSLSSPSSSITTDAAHMLTPTVRRHNPYAPAVACGAY